METTITPIHESESELSFSLAFDEIAQRYEKAYSKQLKDVSLPGFRKGKVPRAMIEKRFGAVLQTEAAEDVANDLFNEYIKENEIHIYGKPVMTDLKFEPQNPLAFSVKYQHNPKFESLRYKGIEIEVKNHLATDELIDDEIKNKLRRKAVKESVDTITDELHYVSITLTNPEESAEGQDNEAKSYPLNVYLDDQRTEPELKNAIMGKKVGDEFEYSFEEKHDHAHDDLEAGHTHIRHYSGKINSAEKLTYPVPDEAYYRDASGGQASNETEFREYFRKMIQEYFDSRMNEEAYLKLIAKIIELNPYTPPAAAVEQYHNAVVDDKLKELQKEGKKFDRNMLSTYLHERNEQFVKLFFLKKEIFRFEKFEVTPEAIDKYAEKLAPQFGGHADQIIEILKNDSSTHDQILDEQFNEFLLANNIIKKVEKYTPLPPENSQKEKTSNDEQQSKE